eukprot:3860440-Pleurochrysis_carterae.AAC.1
MLGQAIWRNKWSREARYEPGNEIEDALYPQGYTRALLSEWSEIDELAHHVTNLKRSLRCVPA